MKENRVSSRRLRRLSTLLFGLLLFLIGSGCGTMSIATEVLEDAAAGYPTTFSLNFKVDPDVARAAQLNIAGFSQRPEGLNAKWRFEGDPSTLTISYLRDFDSIAMLPTLPAELNQLIEDTSIDLVQGMTVIVAPRPDGAMVYTYTANIYIAPTEPVTEGATCNPDTTSLGEYLACAVDSSINENFALKAALDSAGPPSLLVDAILPGFINVHTTNGVESGTKIADGHVRWTLDALHEGEYLLQASSWSFAPTDAMERTLQDVLSDHTSYEALFESAGLDQWGKNSGVFRASQMVDKLKKGFPGDLPPEIANEIVSPFARASVLANTLDEQGKVVFPYFKATAPILARMAQNAVTDEEARRALGRLVELLISLEKERIETRKSAGPALP